MDWTITNNRFVAFFDIMGFKNLVQFNNHDQIIKLMGEISSVVKNFDSSTFGDESDCTIRTTIFSDSIIIISNNDSINSAANIIFHAAFLMRKSVELGIPIKGSIAHGKFTADFDKSLFFGQPLIDAYLLEEELFLYSIVLHHSFESFLIQKKYNGKIFRENDRWFKYLTPFKNGKSKHYHVNWLFYLLNTDPEKIKDFEKYMDNFYNTVSGKTRIYVDNTIELFEQMKNFKNKI
jgi:hypothetical protein